MNSASALRQDAQAILRAGLAAADPRAAVARALTLEGDTLHVAGGAAAACPAEGIWIVGAGKAAPGMALGALDVLGRRIRGGTLTTKDGHAVSVPGLDVSEASHPLPDARGLAGAGEALRAARNAQEGDLLLCLLSGGASALWPAPPPGVTLGDLQQVTDALLRAGAPIGELNTVRKHLSRIAGGQLARAAYPARVVALVISDVVGSPLDVIASGPTVPDPATYAEALDILRRRGVDAPPSVWAHLQAGAAGEIPETPKPGDSVFERVSTHAIAANADALDGAAREAERLGYQAQIITDRMEGEAREAARALVAAALHAREERGTEPRPIALLWGGETTVTVQGNGLGGRNQELALAAAVLLENEPEVLLAALGTDGTDGPTGAAGAMVDGGTVARGRQRGLNPLSHLRRNDSYPFLRATGDLLVTGPTGTNVNDLMLVLVEELRIER